MDKTRDIKYKLLKELKKGNILDTGYQCNSGTRYVEVKNALFEVDKDKIFDTIPQLSYMSPKWYIDNYDPILNENDQLNKCINKLVENPKSRQAVIIMGNTDEYNNVDNTFICTMYMHVFLNQLKFDLYELEYIVHMRSNDCIEFITDLQWHKKIYDIILNELREKTKLYIIPKNIIWNADTIHLYEQFFDQAHKESNHH